MTRIEQKMRKALNNASVLKGNIRDLRDVLGKDNEETHDDLETAICDVMEANMKLMQVLSRHGLHAAL